MYQFHVQAQPKVKNYVYKKCLKSFTCPYFLKTNVFIANKITKKNTLLCDDGSHDFH